MYVSVGGYNYDDTSADQKNAVITAVMFPKFPQDVCADVGVVFGAGFVSLRLAQEALKLFKNGQIDHIILCGGAVINDLPESHKKLFEKMAPPAKDGETEADYMARYLKSQGLDEKYYSVDNVSLNTGENIRNAMGFESFQKAKSVNLIGFSPTRTLMILRKHEDNAGVSRKIATLTSLFPSLDGDVTGDKWGKNPGWEARVIKAFNKLLDCISPSTGFCKDSNLEEEIRLANTLPHLRSIVLTHHKTREFTIAGA